MTPITIFPSKSRHCDQSGDGRRDRFFYEINLIYKTEDQMEWWGLYVCIKRRNEGEEVYVEFKSYRVRDVITFTFVFRQMSGMWT